MIRSVLVLTMVSVLSAASNASAACRWFGTQLDPRSQASRVVIGTQATDRPTYSKSLRPPPSDGTDRVQDDRAAPGLPFALELQDIGADPSLCQNNIGNETYCD